MERKIARYLLHRALFLLLALLPFTSGAAPITGGLPTSVLPGQVARGIEAEFPGESSPSAPIASKLIAPVMPEIPTVSFRLRQVVITGSTIYSAADFAPLYQPYLGTTVTQTDLVRIIQAITARYSRDGYVLSTAMIPKQNFQNGVLKIQIVEAYVNTVHVEGNVGNLRSLLLTYGAKIKQSRPLQQQTLSYYILLANQLPGVAVTAILQPEATLGAYDLVLVVKQKRFAPYGMANNFISPFFGDEQFFLGTNINSVLQPGDTTNLVGGISNETKRFRYLRFYHRFPLGIYGTYFDISAENTHTRPGLNLVSADVVGNSNNYYASINHPFILLPDEKLFGYIGFSYYDNDTTSEGDLLVRDHIRSIRLGGNYTLAGLGGVSNLSASLARGFGILGADQESTPQSAFPPSRTTYMRTNLNISRAQHLFYNFDLYGLLSGQYGFNTLPIFELFPVGGVPLGRAYDPGELAGDSALAGLMELRFNTRPDYYWLNSVQYFTYYDAGRVWNRNALFPQRDSATSAGVGARLQLLSRLALSVELDKPLTHDVLSEQLEGHNPRSWRFFFTLDYNPYGG